MTLRNVLVTGGSGKAGRAVIRELVQAGYRVLNVDLQPSPDTLCHTMKADLNDLGQAMDAMRRAVGTVERRRPFEEAEAVIHLAGIPAPGLAPDGATLQNNFMTTYNVFSAATTFGARRVVWASSETIFGLPLTRVPPAFAPITEEHPALPENSYAMAKLLCEEMARQMHRWNPRTSFIGMRISNILEAHEYAHLAGWHADPHLRKWNLWSYVDSRDVARACRLAIEAPFEGAEHCIIAAADTIMPQTSRSLLETCFPDTPIARPVGEFESLQSSDKAKRLFGYAAEHTWRTRR